MSGREERRGGGGCGKRSEGNRLPRPPPVVYIVKFKCPEYPASGPEYPDSPEFPGPGPETPAPPETEQKEVQKNLI